MGVLCQDIYVSRAGDKGPLGEMYFIQEYPAGNRRVNTYVITGQLSLFQCFCCNGNDWSINNYDKTNGKQ